jgi:hypothetical protein
MNEHESWQTVVNRYGAVVDRLEASIRGLTEDDLDLSLDAESWTIRQYIHHVADGDDIWKVYIKAALGQPRRNLSLRWYWDVPQVTWAETWGYADRAIAPSIDMLRASRLHMSQLLSRIPGAADRDARFGRPGGDEHVLTVRDLVVMQTSHVIHHAEDILEIRERHGV